MTLRTGALVAGIAQALSAFMDIAAFAQATAFYQREPALLVPWAVSLFAHVSLAALLVGSWKWGSATTESRS